jgi:hypothetical protein
METELFQDGGQIKREKDICHHGPKQFQSFATFLTHLLFHYPLPLLLQDES